VPAVPVPLDAERQVAYDAYLAEEPDLAPMGLDVLLRIRAEVDAEVAALGGLSCGGRFTVAQPTVPGLDGDPEIPLLVCIPSGAPASRPVLHHIHGGGFFCNDHRTGLDQVLETAERTGATLISIGYRLAPEHPYPARSTTSTPVCCGPPSTRTSSASTRTAELTGSPRARAGAPVSARSPW
jgi:hypothetical protein